MIPGSCEAAPTDTFPTLRPSAGTPRDEHSLRRRILTALLRQMPTTGHQLEIMVDAKPGPWCYRAWCGRFIRSRSFFMRANDGR